MTISIVDKLNLISSTIDKLFDFIANDEAAGRDFEGYLEKHNIEIHTQSQLGDVLMGYLLDTQGVLERYGTQDEITEALKDNFCSVFEIKNIGKNSFEAHSLTNDKDFTLLPLVKMTNLRSVCRGDYIKARVIKFENEYFILEIFNVIGASRVHIAQREAIKCLIQSPKCAYWQNDEMRSVIEKSAKEFAKKFEEYFGKSVVCTTNKKVDELLECFNIYCEKGERSDYAALIEEPPQYRFIDIGALEDEEDFVETAVGGFSKHAEIYDVALYSDKECGIFIVPFYETISRFEDEKATQYLLESSKNPPSMLLELSKKECFLRAVNKVLEKTSGRNPVKDVQELIRRYKRKDFSPTTVLFNSKVFSQILGYKEKHEGEGVKEVREAGRNEPCPCGSGKKYKKCCMP